MPVVAGALVGASRAWGVATPRLWLWVAWTPLGMTLGLIATPDVPCLLAWCLALWALAARRPIALGVCLAAALWSKSTAVVALPGLLWVARHRLGAGRTLQMGLVALAIYMPHLVWAVANDGVPFSFQASRLGRGQGSGAHLGLGAGRRGLHLFEAIGGQVAVATPPVIWVAWQAWRRPLDGLDRTLRALGLPVLIVWLAMSCLTRVEANWPALAWPATLILVARRASPLALKCAASVTLCALIGWGVVARWVPSLGPPRDPSQWAACVEGHVPVAARYQEAALLQAAGTRVGYLRARGHRLSEYDRKGVKPGPDCGFLYLASPAALGDRCSGPITVARLCGRTVTGCGCVKPNKSVQVP